jgi:hypothetical protein
MTKIVIGFDGSDESRDALHLGSAIAQDGRGADRGDRIGPPEGPQWVRGGAFRFDLQPGAA